MTRHRTNAGKVLDHFFERALKPSAEQANVSKEKVWQRLSVETQPAIDMRGEQTPSIHRPRRIVYAVAAAAVLAITFGITVFRNGATRNDSAMAEAMEGVIYRVAGGQPHLLQRGEKIGQGALIHSDGGQGAVLALADQSRVEMRFETELAIEHADDGLRIHLVRGGVIINAAKQVAGHLYVQTKDVTVSVIGTVFVVNAEEEGSRVAVIEGEVQVQQGAAAAKKLRPGEQVTSNPQMKPVPVINEIAWSRNAETHLSLLQQSVVPPPQIVTAPAAPQDSNVPKWEVVSIRPCSKDSVPNVPGARGGGGGVRSFDVFPGRLSVECLNTADLISLAYVQYGEPLVNRAARRGTGEGWIRGAPEWVQSLNLADRHRIQAKVEGATPDKNMVMGPMLRALLEDRFQLKLHRENEDAPAYALVVAKGGLKIKPTTEGDCEPTTLTGAGGPELLAALRRGVKPPCAKGNVYGEQVSPTMMGWVFNAPTMEMFANTLSSMVRRKVIDQTGTSEHFRFYLEYAPEDGNCALGLLPCPLRTEQNPPITPSGPDIFAAIQEQLGLKLVDASKVQAQYIVIDHIERPSEN
jgi:uncharacterized protein (TIGR03435 family)